MIDYGLEGKTVLITGGNNPRGIGAATAKAFAAQGAAVYVHYFRLPGESPDGAAAVSEQASPGDALYSAMQGLSAEAVVRAIRENGGQAESWEANLADPAAIPQLFDRAETAFAPVEVLVNNARPLRA